MKTKAAVIFSLMVLGLLPPVFSQGDRPGRERPARSAPGAVEPTRPSAPAGVRTPDRPVRQEPQMPTRPQRDENRNTPPPTIGDRPGRIDRGPSGPGPAAEPPRAPQQEPQTPPRQVQPETPRIDIQVNGRRDERPPRPEGGPGRDIGGGVPEPYRMRPDRRDPDVPYTRMPGPEPVKPPFPPNEPQRPPRGPLVMEPYAPPVVGEVAYARGPAPSAGAVLHLENFESASSGRMPTGWTVVYSGQGVSAQGVCQEPGNSFFRAAGRANWSGVVRYDLSEAMPPVVEFQCRLRRSGGSNSIGIGNGSRCVSFRLEDIGIRDGAWHDVLIGVDFAQGAASCTVDGRIVVQRIALGPQDSRAKWSWWGERPAIVLDSGNQGNQTLDIDDIVIQQRL